jgi:5-methylcytosine-specific restriction endonuclease McrA
MNAVEARRNRKIEQKRAWRLRNPDKVESYRRKHYLEHKEDYITKALVWRDKNPKRFKENQKKHDATPKRKAKERVSRKVLRESDPEKARTISRRKAHRRRALNPEGHYTEEQLQARIDLYGGRCYLCDCDWDALPAKSDAQPGEHYKTIDHVIPLSKDGTNWPANLRPACDRCNSSKRDNMPTELVA